MSNTESCAGIVTAMFLLAACQDRTTPPPSPTATASRPSADRTIASATTTNVPDAWLGEWNGPEGTSLILSRNGDQYVVQIQTLDGPATYVGAFARDRIEFKRDGKTQSIRAGSGSDTGMKWLMEKEVCLIIKEGEGFCRE